MLLKVLYLKSSVVSKLYNPMNDGILPCKLLRALPETPARFKVTSAVNDENDDGIEPDKQFPYRYR